MKITQQESHCRTTKKQRPSALLFTRGVLQAHLRGSQAHGYHGCGILTETAATLMQNLHTALCCF